MNRRTFGDAVQSRVTSLANDLEEDDGEDVEMNTKAFRGKVEGEVDGNDESYDDDGVAMEPFNLNGDREIGHFDEHMNFIFKKESGEVDGWLSGMTEEEMERTIGEAAHAVKRKETDRLKSESIAVNKSNNSTLDIKIELLSFMQSGETVAACMRRLSGKGKGAATQYSTKRMQPNATAAQLTKEQLKENRIKIGVITDISNELLSRGYTSVYDLTYEALQNSMAQWEYKGQDGTIHGPYEASQIAMWKSQGFFVGETAVLMRRVIVNKKRDADNSLQSPTKRVKFDTQDKSNTSLEQDLLDDMDDLEDHGQVSTSASSPEQQPAVQPPMNDNNDWQLSDDIDFGPVNDDLTKHKVTSLGNSNQKSLPMDSDDEGGVDDGMSKRNNRNKRNQLKGQDHQSDEDDE